MARHARGQRAAEQFAHDSQPIAFVLAEGHDRAVRFHHGEFRVGGRIAFVVDEAPRGHLLALVVGHARLALRHDAGGEIEQDRVAARHRDAHREGIRPEARIAAAEGRDDRARNHVGEMHRDEIGRHRHLRPRPDAAQVVRIPQRHYAAAELLRARNAQFHRLVADDLPEAGLAVEAQHRAAVERGLHVRVRLEPALDIRF